jgi:hypothetical protein
MADFSIKRGNLGPALGVVLELSDGAPVDLTGTTVAFSMYSKGDPTTPKVDAVAATIIDAANGVVEYRWTGTDTDTAGSFLGEFTVTFPDTTPQTHPNDRDLRIEIFARPTQ